ncbi:uncharacterized protein BcabD6B2_53610 [Babesia caballi]|uniref:Uncharacterized protein n=1 Tax=Babesia caballi TaxID=5871 RepID=A0AAV4M0D9_BABCB|nr:hypothetical protein, conserved [Babesia caballi]
MVGQGYVADHLNGNKKASEMIKTALGGFTEITTPPQPSASTYAEFFQKLREVGIDKWRQGTSGPQNAQTHPLSGFYILTSSYFLHQQHLNARDSRTPTTIREMLYWLSGLQFSPNYNELQIQIESNIPSTGLRVADSAKPSTSGSSGPGSASASAGDTLTRKDFNEYLTSTCVFAPALLGTIQGNSADSQSEPWLYSLFSNNMNLQYPSGSALFNTLANYSYALQFQLYFLYQQCSNTYTKACGWNQCTYGQDINKSTASQIVSSHICPTGCTKSTSEHNHSTRPDQCEHNGCGSNSKSSPLQAFLTDKLRGFSRGHPSDPSSHLASCSGSLCHVPMGFNPKDLRTASNANTQGENICLTLRPFCGGFNTPLRQLCEKLGCLTKRTPRTLGDMFGFTWHLKAQLSATLNNITNAEWLRDLKVKLPFSYQLTSESGQKLNKFVGTGHSGHSKADLSSLYSSGCKEKGNNCGPYLYPLTHSEGATYAPKNASAYLSWVLYLTDDLQSWFQEMTDEIPTVQCTNNNGSHRASPNCSCSSVVECSGVLPLLYRHGFRFLSAFRLKG